MLGFVGAGNMAGAIARGLGEPIYATDNGSGRAAALVAELGGEVMPSNADLFRRSDTIFLGHRPDQLAAIAEGIDATGKLVISMMGPTTIAQLQDAYPGATVVRTMPNTPVEVRRGVVAVAEGGEPAVDLLSRLGTVVVLPERQMDLATATAGVMPALIAVLAEAAIDAAVCHGLDFETARDMFLETMAGTAELLIKRDGDTLAVRREVGTPGESTVRGVAALERNNVRTAFMDAFHDVLTRLSRPYLGGSVVVD
ncbi:pyrroline-5-carboxylate reductase family protein [Kribbella sp. CWNU-51]|uniref:pyrroline-5-carboxylate reductase family protein n=1 Tax=Kribbella sp. NBC_01484 TaxID=2903579 RepID=UPI002E341271|nr:pyrroline-5-carboxylate reductase [Kribbella sp. NBC_01484]